MMFWSLNVHFIGALMSASESRHGSLPILSILTHAWTSSRFFQHHFRQLCRTPPDYLELLGQTSGLSYTIVPSLCCTKTKPETTKVRLKK